MRWPCLIAVGLFAIGCAEAHAQVQEPLTLEWDVPRGCPSAAEAQERIHELAAGKIPAGSTLSAAARIKRSRGGQFHLTLRTRAGELEDQRQLASDTCSDLVTAAAVHIALLLHASQEAPDDTAEPAVSSTPQSNDNGSTPTLDVVVAADARSIPEPDPAPTESVRSPRILLQVPMVTVSVGSFTRPALGASAAAGAAVARWRLFIEGRVWQRHRLSTSREPGVHADLYWASGALRACWAATLGSLELSPCVLGSVEHAWARGSGPHVAASTGYATWFAAGFGIQLRVALTSWLGLAGQLDFQIETARPRIEIDGVGRLGQLGHAALVVGFGPQWNL